MTLLADDDDDDGLVTVGVGDESNGVSYGDVLITAAPGVVVSAFRFTPFFVYINTTTFTGKKVKTKGTEICIAPDHQKLTSDATDHMDHTDFTLQTHHTCL